MTKVKQFSYLGGVTKRSPNLVDKIDKFDSGGRDAAGSSTSCWSNKGSVRASGAKKALLAFRKFGDCALLFLSSNGQSQLRNGLVVAWKLVRVHRLREVFSPMNRRRGLIRRMLAGLLLLILCLAARVSSVAQPAGGDPCAAPREEVRLPEPPRLYHYVLMVDTSKSMMGMGDGRGRVLLPRVKEEIVKFLDQVSAGSRVTVQPFDDGPKAPRTFEIPQQKGEASEYLRRIEATGKRTCIYRSLKQVLRNWPGDVSTGVLVYLFTDGNNNCPPPPTLEEVTQEYRLRRGQYDWLYYILLGLEVSPELEKALEHEEGWKVLSLPPNKVPRLPLVDAEPKSLDLGNLYAKPSAVRELQLRAEGGSDQALRFKVRALAPELAAHGSALTVSPALLTEAGRQTLTFELLNPVTLPHRDGYQGYVCIESGDEDVVMKPISLPVRFRFHPRGTFRIDAIDKIDALTLQPGATATVHYLLQGDSWAKGKVKVTHPGAEEGLRVLINGSPGVVEVAAGETLAVELQNVGMKSAAAVEPQLMLSYPPETGGPAAIALPLVSRPLTWWEKWRRWWWLLLPLLLAMLAKAWQMRSWGYLAGTGPPPECRELRGKLRGRRPVDLGKVTGLKELEGVRIQRKGAVLMVKGIGDQPGRRLECEGDPLEDNEPIKFGEEVTVVVDGTEKGMFVIWRRGQKA